MTPARAVILDPDGLGDPEPTVRATAAGGEPIPGARAGRPHEFIVGIDPGTRKSGVALLTGGVFHRAEILENERLLHRLRLGMAMPLGASLVVESMEPSPRSGVGRSVLETAVWIGRFLESWSRGPSFLARRVDIKRHLGVKPRRRRRGAPPTPRGLGVPSADAAVRAAMAMRHGAPGEAEHPGPTFGLRDDAWSALAVATYGYDYLRLGITDPALRWARV